MQHHLFRLTAYPALILLALLPSLGQGAEPAGLYEGEVLVEGRDDGQRQEALGRALRQVIGKLTGQRRVPAKVVAAATRDAARYLQQYQYRGGEGSDTALRLWASFDSVAMDALVRNAGLPVWGRQRPRVLAWVVLRRDSELELLAPGSGTGLADAMLAEAWRRGLPLQFPLLDLEDRVRIQAVDVWSLNRDTIVEASARYGSGPMLIGRLSHTLENLWEARWTLKGFAGESTWATQSEAGQRLAEKGVAAVTDRIALRLASVPDAGPSGGVQIRVSGVRSVSDYARTFDYLRSLDQISGLELSGASADELWFRFELRGGPEAFSRLAAFGEVLEQERAANGTTLRFRLIP